MRHTLIILTNFSMICAGPTQNLEKIDQIGRKPLKLFEDFSLSIKITKQNKNYSPLNYMWHSYNFMQLQYMSLLNLAQNLRKITQTANNTYNWLFFLSLSNLPRWFWSWKKTKAIMYANKLSWFLWNTVRFLPEPAQNFEETDRNGQKYLGITIVDIAWAQRHADQDHNTNNLARS